ncbi:MAG TPA: choice-of-anchor Q domain-containing protein [Kofleriaceae bacterium]
MTGGARWLVIVALIGAAATHASAGDWYVATGGTGDGSAGAPFGTVQQGLDAAMPGDVVHVAPGTYGAITTRRAATLDAPIVVRGEPGVIVTAVGRALTVSHPYQVFERIVFDGQYGEDDTVRIETPGTGATLRECEVRRATLDCIDMGAPVGVLIEGSTIHHCLNAAGGRTDAHGIVTANVRDLVIRRTQIHSFSGDAIQVDPGRATPAWDNVVIEECLFWLEPLPEAANGFPAGTVTGENAVDTKVPAGATSRLTIRDTTAHGFRAGLLTNMAAFNLKEDVTATLDRITIYNSEIGLRLRAPAKVAVTNALIYDADAAVRYENDIVAPQIYASTIGARVTNAFVEASSDATVIDSKNVLLLAAALPPELSSATGSLAVDASSFKDAAADDYHLVAGSPAIDQGVALDLAIDRDGITRPQGAAQDVGAYERCEPECTLPPDGGPIGGGDTSPRDSGGCCNTGDGPGTPALLVLGWLLLTVVRTVTSAIRRPRQAREVARSARGPGVAAHRAHAVRTDRSRPLGLRD